MQAAFTFAKGDYKMKHIKFGSGKENFVILPGLSIHSIMRAADAIKAAYDEFTEKYTVYVFDRADNIASGYTVRDMAMDTADAMKALGIEKADIFGASQGGMIALYLAIDHPELVNKIILASTLAKPNDNFNHVIDEWIELAEKKDEIGLLNSFAEKVYSAKTLAAYGEILVTSNLGISDEEYRRFIILAEACMSYNCFDELSQIKCPAYVIGAEGDNVTTPDGSVQLAEALKCGLYLYSSEFGHGVYDEAPDYRRRCLDYLLSDK